MKPYLFLLAFGLCGYAFAQDNEFHLDKEYDIDPAGTIELHSDDAQITITGTDRSTAHVKIDWELNTTGIVSGQKDFDVEVTPKNGNLTIRQQEKGNLSVVGSVNEDYTIVIEAPKGVSLKLKGDDDDYEIRNINGSIVLNNDDGDAHLTQCGSDYFEFNVTDGDIKLDQGQGELVVKMDDGNLEVENGRFTKIDARNDDGDLIIETSLADGGTYALKTSDADIRFTVTEGGGNFDIQHDDSSIRTSNSFRMLEEDETFTRLQLPDGNAEVTIRTDDSQIRLNSGR